MSLPSKNRRTIQVAGRRYHWVFNPHRLSGNDGYIAVQNASGTGSRLYLRWVGLALPRSIRAAILFAMENGWSPDAGGDMEVGCDAFAEPSRFYLRPDGAGPYWFHDWWFAQNPARVFATPRREPDYSYRRPGRRSEVHLTGADIRDRLSSILPEFAPRRPGARDANFVDDQPTRGEVFSALSEFFRMGYPGFTRDQSAQCGRFISECVASVDDDLTRAAIDFLKTAAADANAFSFGQHLTGEAFRLFGELAVRTSVRSESDNDF